MKQKYEQPKQQSMQAESREPKVTFARLVRVGAAWQVMSVDLPESMAAKYLRHGSEPDLYPNVERKLLVEARKTDYDRWK